MQILRRSLVAALVVTLALSAAAAAKPPGGRPRPAAAPGDARSRRGCRRSASPACTRGSSGSSTRASTPGAISLVARNGKIVDWRTYGKRDLEAGLPMEKDTICRIYSMSKIVTSVAVLTLLEEARFRLDDPIGDYLPELARMKVLTGGTVEKPLLADAKTPITIRHLLTHTSGLTYDFGDGTIDKIFRQVKPFDASSMGEFVERVSRLPLAHEPGERFTYGVSTDVLGALVEKVSGRSLADVPRGAGLAAARDEGHRLRRPRGEARPAREGLREGPGRQAPAGEVAPRAGARPAAEAPERGRGPASRRPATTPASCRCC